MNNMKDVKYEYDVTSTGKQVDFDKSKHLSDKAIRKRRLEREKLMELEQEKEAAREAEK